MLLSIFLADILPVFLIAAVGFVLARHFDVSATALSRIIFNALSPCLVFTMLATSSLTGGDIQRMVLFTIFVIAAVGAVTWLVAVALRLDRPTIAALLLVVMFSNQGNYGLPVVLFAFGREALTLATVYFVASALMAYTVGVFLASSGRRSLGRSLTGILRVPAVYAAVAGSLVLVFHLQVPIWLMRPVTLLSDAGLPMMILVLGMQLERTTWPERPALVLVAVTMSLIVSPILAFLIAMGMGLSGAAQQAAMVQASMPAAVVTTIIAMEFDASPGFVTSVVAASTLLSPLTLTVIIAWLQRAG